jgi:hypothetical protein
MLVSPVSEEPAASIFSIEDPDDEVFIWNIGTKWPNYMMSEPRISQYES